MVSLGYFFVITLLGLLLRFFFVTPVPLNYNYILHTHSHTALLGGIYLGMLLLIQRLFLSKTSGNKTFKWIFHFTNFTVLGMLFTFPIQGYALYSITFSVLYLLGSYWFTWYALKYVPDEIKNRFSWKLIKFALFYLVFSSLGTWAIGPISGMAGTDSFWFNDALYFFLHFLYSGFFFLTLMGGLFYFLEKKGIQFDEKRTDSLYVNLNLGVILSYFLSVLWTKPPLVFYLLGGLGALFQLKGYWEFFRIMFENRKVFQQEFTRFFYGMLKMAGVLLIIRIFMQVFSALPYFAELAFKFRDFIIGYLHMVFLGLILPILFLFMAHYKMIRNSKIVWYIFFVAFFTTEALIFYKAYALWLRWPMFASYYQLLAGFSCLFPIASGWLLIHNLRGIKKKID